MKALTNREERESLQKFYCNHPANALVPKTTNNLADCSFEEFCLYLGIDITKDQKIISSLIESRKQTVVVSSHGIGKCVAENDIITLADGSEVAAKTLVGKQFQLKTITNDSIITVDALADFNDVENCYVITSELGKEIIRNSEHPLYCATKWSKDGTHPQIYVHGWLTVREIIEKDEYYKSGVKREDGRRPTLLIATTKELPCFGDDSSVSDDELKIMAYIIGDGSVTTRSVNFTQTEGKQLDEFKQCVTNLGCSINDSYKDEYRYIVKNKDGNSYTNTSITKEGKRIYQPRTPLINDFTDNLHISTANICKHYNTSYVYNTIRFLGIPIVNFYGRGYISLEQYELFKKYTELKNEIRDKNKRKDYLLKDNECYTLTQVDEAYLQNKLNNSIAERLKSQNIKQGCKTNGSIKNPVVSLLESHNIMGKHSRDKLIPDAIFKLPKRKISLFLSRLFATDGWACVSNGGSRTSMEIGFCSINKSLVEQIQRLLLRFNISSTIDKKVKVNAYQLVIHRIDSIIKFIENIGIFGKEEQIELVYNLAKSKLNSKQIPKWRTKKAPFNTEWESIESITKLDNKTQTVAICVPEHHTYLTTYYEHNSMISACQILYTTIIRKGLGIVTAPTARQVKSIIFSEINRGFQKLKRNKEFQRKYGINLDNGYAIGHTFIRELEKKETSETRLKFWYDPVQTTDDFVESNNYEGLGYAFGFTSKHNDSNAFQGLHYAGFMLIIADEACGISFEIMEAIEACATGIDNHILLIGNPIARGNPFEKAAKEQGCFRVTCFSHPNVAQYYEERGKDNWVLVDDSCLLPSYKPVINGAVTPQWIEAAREKYGTNSLFWWTRVLAKFPRLGHGAGSLIPVEFVESTCEPIELNDNQSSQFAIAPIRVGIDVGESEDPTVIAISQEIEYGERKINVVRGIFELETFGDGMQAERNYEFAVTTISHFLNSTFLTESSVIISVDNTGLGVSLTRDLLKNHTYQVNAVHFAASASNPKTFLNIRAEMAWKLRESFLNASIKFHTSVIDTYIDQLKYEISGVSYEQDSTSEKIKLLAKKDIKTILGCSPNVFDAMCLLVESNRFANENT